MWCKRLTLEKCISFRMKWFFSPPFLSVSPFLLLSLVRRQCYAYAVGLYTRPEIKSRPDVKFCAHVQCVLPRYYDGTAASNVSRPLRPLPLPMPPLGSLRLAIFFLFHSVFCLFPHCGDWFQATKLVGKLGKTFSHTWWLNLRKFHII